MTHNVKYRSTIEHIHEQTRVIYACISCHESHVRKFQLPVVELQHSFAVEVGEVQFDEESMPDIVDMFTFCPGLVVLDPSNETIQSTHHTTLNNPNRTRGEVFRKVHGKTAIICSTYLFYEAFEVVFYTMDVNFHFV